MDFETIKSILPQDIPFLMIDKVVERIPGETITCVKNISGNDLVFLGHFPNQSIFPGVLITEAMAQASILLYSQSDQTEDDMYLLTSTKLRFLHSVTPGDQLVIKISEVRASSSGVIVEASAQVEETVAAKGQLSFAVQSGQGGRHE